MGYLIEFILPGVPKATNALFNTSWHQRHKNAVYWKKLVRAITLTKAPHTPLESVQIDIIRYNYRSLDYDGLVASMKPIVDGLVESKILRNDTYKITGKWNVGQEYIKKGQEHVWIRITEKLSEEH